MRKLLFVCSRNRQRSLTAERIFANPATSGQAVPGPDGSHLDVRSAGTEPGARTKLTPGLLGWADVVFVMEKKHRDWILQRYADLVVDTPIINLLIADDFAFMDEELVDILRSRVEAYLADA